jgi:hypothetical protein
MHGIQKQLKVGKKSRSKCARHGPLTRFDTLQRARFRTGDYNSFVEVSGNETKFGVCPAECPPRGS